MVQINKTSIVCLTKHISSSSLTRLFCLREYLMYPSKVQLSNFASTWRNDELRRSDHWWAGETAETEIFSLGNIWCKQRCWCVLVQVCYRMFWSQTHVHSSNSPVPQSSPLNIVFSWPHSGSPAVSKSSTSFCWVVLICVIYTVIFSLFNYNTQLWKNLINFSLGFIILNNVAPNYL